MRANNDRIARALLSTLSQDQPSPEARRKVMAALCVGSTAAAVISTAAGAKAGAGATSAAASVGVLGIAKAFVAGALAAVVTVQVGDHVIAPMLDQSSKHASSNHASLPSTPSGAPRSSPARSFPQETIAPTSPPSRGTLPEGDNQPASPTIPPSAPGIAPPPPGQSVSIGGSEPRELAPKALARPRTDEPSAPRVEAAPVPSAPAYPAVTPAAKTAPTLLEEIHHLDRARAALRAGAVVQARAELDRYDGEFPAGGLRPEAMVVRIELLLKTGDDAGARSLARAFASAYPTSGHLPKIRQLLATKAGTPSP